MCENLRFERLPNYTRTARVRFSNMHVKPNSLIGNIAYLLVECCIIARCGTVDEV